MPDIDMIIPWVDGSDPAWLVEKNRYSQEKVDDRMIRYRDWGLLPYVFRGIERYLPWIRTVHFITCGQIPDWLNTSHPKLHLVNHADYLPSDALPTFNVNPIELCVHRIEGLAEQFIYSNDDIFFLRSLKEEDFFLYGIPRDDAIFSPVMPIWGEESARVTQNDMFLINKHFEKPKVLRLYRNKFFSLRYGSKLLRTLCLFPWRHFPGFYNDHLPTAYTKTTFQEVWNAEPDLLEEVVHHRFRDYYHDVNHWLMRYWQFCTGRFIPISPNRGINLNIDDECVSTIIIKQKYGMICLNDNESISDPEQVADKVRSALDFILPDKSGYER